MSESPGQKVSGEMNDVQNKPLGPIDDAKCPQMIPPLQLAGA